MLDQWITSFLTDRQQLVRLGKFTSNTHTISTGAPQGCVLSPLLFSLYTNDCTSKNPSVKLLKFADDTTVIGLIQDGDESAYRQEVEQLAVWCSHNNLELHTLKTVEMIVDFRRNPPALPLLTVMDSTVAAVESFKYLGTTISQDLKWDIHIEKGPAEWITSFLTDRQQLVRLGKFTSNTRTISTGAPQGCVLSPLLFSLYTNDCTSKDPSVKLLKFADDTTVICLIQDGDESAYRHEVEQLAVWCSHNNLELNMLKTAEMIVDFRRNPPALPLLTVMDSTVAAVESFKFLGTTISQDLKWDIHIDSIVKKAQQSHNNLELNTLKTVEMIVDFRRNPPALPLLTVMDSTVAAVESFKYLGTTISQDLKWDIHIDSIVKKAQQSQQIRYKKTATDC
ncbi:hypothetical protein PGIGA_G00147050 [Pangasianodon gigas]|uniref:Uncharacterized protein n=1 Tax=Pangasianodon gigas TaxID=30993 RepID=A0ACC5XN69_PANGG|nr:hypothetical protein [Pangasianodon gigas]